MGYLYVQAITIIRWGGRPTRTSGHCECLEGRACLHVKTVDHTLRRDL